MGYSELLVEEATDIADDTAAKHFSDIYKLGERLLQVLDHALPSAEQWSTEHFVNLHMRARPVVETLIVLSAPGTCAEAYLEISGKIHHAAKDFLDRVERLQLKIA
jgi:hypothetical protein